MTPITWPATLSIRKCLATTAGPAAWLTAVNHCTLLLVVCIHRTFSWTLSWSLTTDFCIRRDVSRAAELPVQNSCINLPVSCRYCNTMQTTVSVTPGCFSVILASIIKCVFTVHNKRESRCMFIFWTKKGKSWTRFNREMKCLMLNRPNCRSTQVIRMVPSKPNSLLDSSQVVIHYLLFYVDILDAFSKTNWYKKIIKMSFEGKTNSSKKISRRTLYWTGQPLNIKRQVQK